jgi:hypothetical protein
MVAVVFRQVVEQQFHAGLVMVEPDHVLADFRTVGRDGVMKGIVAQAQVAAEIPCVQQHTRLVNQLFDLVTVLHCGS